MTKWTDDPEFKNMVAEFARKDYEANKDNPYAAIGYANVLLSLNGYEGIPIIPKRSRLQKFIRSIRKLL